jgi:hypothetical protein
MADFPTDPRFERIKEELRDRYKELQEIHDEIVAQAKILSAMSAGSKGLLIFLGAVATTKAVADEVIGQNNRINTLTFAVIGILTATLAGLEATFKWERRSGEMLSLAAVCAMKLHNMQDRWSRLMIQYPDGDANWLEQVEKVAKADLDFLDAKLDEIYVRGGQLGVKSVARYQMKINPQKMFREPVRSSESSDTMRSTPAQVARAS